MPIEVKNLSHIYSKGTPFESKALDDVSFQIEDGEFTCIIGHTGSGKSTLIQHLNGILKKTSGSIIINNEDITDSNMDLTRIRKKVGLVFQYPEYQLFEETIEKDIAYGPRNLEIEEDKIKEIVKESMEMVGLDYSLKDRSPFELSGGQRRRVAIAGVIAMRPEVLILDEPTAGLDPHGRDEILDMIRDLHNKYNTTIILVSHSMEDVAKIADKLIVMANGRVKYLGTPREVFQNEEGLKAIGLDIPKVSSLMNRLKEKGFDVRTDIINIEEAKEEILRVLRGDNNA
ncbi:energy-coupling factor transporter ATPase [Peptostreptococcaceae bacterium AGR-M142]